MLWVVMMMTFSMVIADARSRCSDAWTQVSRWVSDA